MNWPKISFRSFGNSLQRNPNKLFGQRNICSINSQLGVICSISPPPPQRTSEDVWIHCCHDWMESITGIQWIETRIGAKHLVLHRTAPQQTNNYVPQNVSSVRLRNPDLEGPSNITYTYILNGWVVSVIYGVVYVIYGRICHSYH